MSITTDRWLEMLTAAESGTSAADDFSRYLQAGYRFPENREQIVSRYRRLTRTHLSRFPSNELCVARAPGRVNLIGEHTDYNGLPVFPVAVDRDMAALLSPRDDGQVVIANTNPSFEERRFPIEPSIPPFPTGDWGNYCKAAVQGMLDFYRLKHRGADRFHGFQATVDGDIPVAAGMSSSSALVVLSALLFLESNELDLHRGVAGRLTLADRMAAAEHYVGTQGGGMDQAISLMGLAGQALKIDFFPLRTEAVPLPPEYAIVVANSTVRAAKTAEALDRYNRRPVECRLAAAILKRIFSQRCGREVPITLLGDLKEERLALPEAEIWEIADSTLHEHPYTLAEIAGILGQSPEKTAALFCKRRDGSTFPEPADGFKLQQRYRHVVGEGRRVQRSVAALRAGDIPGFASLMNLSHESCRDLYEISCPELDRLVEIAREGGAEGSRLTGAGFGGCTVSLVKQQAADRVIRYISDHYYREYLGREGREFGSLVFSCRTSAGAAVLAEE